MRNSYLRRYAALALACAIVSCAVLVTPLTRVRAQRSAINTYAITNARIVTVSGATIERGTVVVRDGLIAAVGANAAAPADARVIDGNGLTVYPGLIDANTTLGMGAAAAAPRPGGGGGGAPGAAASPQAGLVSPNSSQPPGLQPEVLAADIITPGGAQIEAARSAGITAALTAPREGIFIGQSAIINLAGDTPQQMIVRSPVALHMGFTPLRTGTYPTSLMGVFSAIRQMFLDAQRYRTAQEIYARNPRGIRRPEQDKSLAALLPVLAREIPVVMQASTEREIVRALDLAQEFNLRAIIAGGNEAWKVADRLRALNVPVLLSLNFPRRATAPSPEADPEPVRVLRERVETPRGAGRLATAGVRFAFQSGAMTNISDFLANATRAVEGGLARDEAVRAMTIRPAEILGVADRLGSIEVGKIANLTVTRGDILDRNRQIAHVFIDGRPVELTPAAQGAGARGGATQAGATGDWSLRVSLGQGTPDANMTLNLRQEGERLSGGVQGDFGSAEIANASISTAGAIRFTANLTIPGGQTAEATFTGTVAGNQMTGSVQVVGRGTGTFTGTRAGAPPSPTGGQPQTPPNPAAATDLTGTWSFTISGTGGSTIPATATFQQQGAQLTGTVQSQFGTSEVTQGSVGADGFRFIIRVTAEGQTFDVTLTGTATGNQMSGTIITPQGPAPFTGVRTP